MKRFVLVLAAVTAVLMLSLTGFAQSSYTWALSCSAATLGTGVGTGATWVWLHDGVQISFNSGSPNGFASCATPPLSGSGEIPASINGIQVNGIEVDLSVSESPAGCQAFASLKKSFDPTDPKISIKENVSVPGTVDFAGVKENCPKAGFSFSLSN
jgi:hypothetical protein